MPVKDKTSDSFHARNVNIQKKTPIQVHSMRSDLMVTREKTFS